MKPLYKFHDVYGPDGDIYICVELGDEYWFAYAHKSVVVKHRVKIPIIRLLLDDPSMVIRSNINHKTNEVKHDICISDDKSTIKVGYIITKSGYDNCIRIGHGTNKDDFDKSLDRYVRKMKYRDR